MSEKKYKYTVKRFAKMLTVHPDKRVTFQDDVDLRVFIGPQPDVLDHPPPVGLLTDLITSIVVDSAHVWTTERTEYWPDLVEHGELLAIANEQFDPPQAKLVGLGGRFIIGVQFELEPDKVAAWLAATGFPQMSRAKESDNANTDVVG